MDLGSQQGPVDALAEAFNLLATRSVGLPVLGSLSLKVCAKREAGEMFRPCNIHGGDSSVIDEPYIQNIRDSRQEDEAIKLRILKCASTTMNTVTQALRSSHLQMETIELVPQRRHARMQHSLRLLVGLWFAVGGDEKRADAYKVHLAADM